MSDKPRSENGFSVRMIIAFVVVLAMAALFNLWAILREPPHGEPVLEFNPAMMVWRDPVCPDDAIPIETIFTVNSPAVIGTEIGVISEATSLTVWVDQFGMRVRDRAESVRYAFTWTVPDLPAGEYRRVNASWAANEDARIATHVLHFTIAEDCP